MRTFRLALAQINSTVGDLEGNCQKILRYVEEARAAEADLVAFPELAITGYPAEDLLFKTSFIEDNARMMKRVVEASRGISVVVGFVDAKRDIYNAAAVGYDGVLVDVYHKMYLPTYGVFDEDRYFKRGDTCPVYIINGTSVGVSICEDIWYPVGPMVVQREAGAEVAVNINASPFSAEKQSMRERMIATRASDNGLYTAYLNLVGGQDELVFDGSSTVFGPEGQLLTRGRAFEEEMLVIDLDVTDVLRNRLRNPLSRKAQPDVQKGIGASRTLKVSNYTPRKRQPVNHREPSKPLSKAEEVYKALVTGTRDYVRKTGFSRVIIGLSGGIDSALTACVAADALGAQNVLGVSMPSRYSSEGSIVDAKMLAQNLGIDMWTVPIEEAHRAYLNTLEPTFRGTQPNVTEQNIQSRIRGNILMAISNKFGWLVLTTGNKSEMAMGYATLYGDMAGGFAVIKDVPKTLVYELAHWRNAHGTPSKPIPQASIDKPPSAELRPNQTDQDDLPAYDLLDQILKLYVEEERSYQEIVSMGFDSEVVKRVIRAVDLNEYKRRQAPPGVKITPRAFGKDRRMPIVNKYRGF
jgi:NAD+ synthase (glutamine-hydrolysing)